MTLETLEGQQLTIGGLIAQLGAFPEYQDVLVAGFGNSGVPVSLRRHRPYRNDVVIEAGYNPHDTCRALQLVTMLRSHASQPATENNPNPSTLDSPVWVDENTAGPVSFKAVVRVDSFSGHPVIRWVDVAPVHGPGLQRLPDVEVLRRNAEVNGRTNASLDPDTEGNRWELAYLPRARDEARNELPMARAGIVRARKELERALREVAALETKVGDIDYILGLTDVRPAGR